MRTTIDIPDAMYRRLKTRAASEGRSAKALILQGVEQVLRTVPATKHRRVKLPLVRSNRPGTIRIDHATLYDLISFP
jgi:plasmid stability protein